MSTATLTFKRAARVALALLLAVFSTNIVPAMSVSAASNNGTLKVHEKGTPSGSESNDPKVCIFNFEVFGVDANQTGDITIADASGPNNPVLLTIPMASNASGYGETSPYVNDTGSIYTLANGHYKATLDDKFGTDNGDKAKSKVFKVTCASQPTVVTPSATFTDACGTANDTVTGVDIDGINYSVTANGLVYTVVASPVSGYTLAAGNGFTLNNDGTATRVITLTNANCPLTVTPCQDITGPTVVTADSQFADSQDTRTAGHYEFVDGGLKIYTDNATSQAKVAWYHNVDYPLADVGVPSMDYTVTTGIAPGLQLVVDFDGNGTADGILVGESVYGNDWWLSNSAAQFVKDNAPSHTGGYGSDNHGTLDQWLTNFPTAQVKSVGFSLGSGVYASGVLHSLTFGCHKYEFDAPLQPATPIEPTAVDYCYGDQDGVWVDNSQTDVEYTVTGGTMGVNGFVPYEGKDIVVTATAKSGHVLTGYTGPWTFGANNFTNKQCVTIKKSAKVGIDTNSDGKISVGDKVQWTIEITNTSQNRIESFRVDVVDPTAVLDCGVNNPDCDPITLNAGQTVTITATSTITLNDAFVCKVTNKADASIWRQYYEEESEGLNTNRLLMIAQPTLPTASATAEYPLTCTPGQGSVNSETPKTPSPTVQELPRTGTSSTILLAGFVAAVITYGAVYFAQPRKQYEQ